MLSMNIHNCPLWVTVTVFWGWRCTDRTIPSSLPKPMKVPHHRVFTWRSCWYCFQKEGEVLGLWFDSFRPVLCPFHPFYAIQLVSFKSFMLALHIYLQPCIKINTFSLKFIWCVTVLERISSGNTGKLEISSQVNIWGLVPESYSSSIKEIFASMYVKIITVWFFLLQRNLTGILVFLSVAASGLLGKNLA